MRRLEFCIRGFDQAEWQGQDESLRHTSYDVVRQTRKLPLILQDQNHSKTIVGYEETITGINLLVLDPYL